MKMSINTQKMFRDHHIETFQFKFELASTNDVGCIDDKYIKFALFSEVYTTDQCSKRYSHFYDPSQGFLMAIKGC